MSLIVPRAVYAKKTCREQRVKFEKIFSKSPHSCSSFALLFFLFHVPPFMSLPPPSLLPSVNFGERPWGKCGQHLANFKSTTTNNNTKKDTGTDNDTSLSPTAGNK